MFINKIKAIPRKQKIRYFTIFLGLLAFIGPIAFVPQLAGADDMCGVWCMRRFYLYYPGMTFDDFWLHLSVALVGVLLFILIMTITFFNGRLWCSYVCPIGGMTELGSRLLNDRWKIEFRSLPQVPIRYGYFAVFILVMPMLGISACNFCNFITVPRLVEALSGEYRGLAFILSSVGLVNLGLVLLLGFFANKGRAYCQFLCPIGAVDGIVNRVGAHFRYTHHIRVEHARCSGCKICAEKCMCGAIKMIDQIAVVDQYSCMSCHECVDVCDWNAIELTTGPRNKSPRRIKKNISIHPEPDWQSISKPALRAKNSTKKLNAKKKFHEKKTAPLAQ
ncbi:MAG: 4Fe-4S binding protein [Pseudomonadota bacterium]